MSETRTRALWVTLLFAVPWVFIAAAFAALPLLRLRLLEPTLYSRYSEVWGGNQHEIFSHWLDLVLMSGCAAALAWLVTTEAFVRRRVPGSQASGWSAALGIALSGVTAGFLDAAHGEGTAVFVHATLFVPMLVASFYLLRRLAEFVAWRPAVVLVCAIGYAGMEAAFQLWYEPSDTGAPNGQIFPVWFAHVGLAVTCLVWSGIRSGKLGRSAAQLWQTLRQPVVWGTIAVALLAVGIPATIRAHRVHTARQTLVLPWLDQLEHDLRDDVVADLKARLPQAPHRYQQFPIPPAIESLLGDARVQAGNQVRIYVPLDGTNYLFLTGNYCDVRPLATPESGELDQEFIQDLLRRGGTMQTGMYAALRAPYIAGRVLKDAQGAVKAVCVINSPDPEHFLGLAGATSLPDE
jgi:hypothetical protein